GGQAFVLEIGTGSGCIIISIIKRIMNYELGIKGFATDISGRALLVAKRNAKLHKVNNKIKFIKSDLLKNISDSLFVIHNSILVANLPYLPEKYKKQVDKDLFFEPQKALYAGKDGLFFINKLLKQISQLKNKPKYILLEIGHEQDKEIKKIVKNILPEYKIKIKKDLSGLNRVLILL
ncbi:HemK family protein methyltransferase, partial [Patescibacteria group bacterium]|nr:HemK family protein methyltransferase [Patescibacteria group bacterium]